MLTYVIWEMFYKEILKQIGPGSAFLEHLEVQILKNSPLDANYGGAFVYVPVCPKKIWILNYFHPVS